MGKLEECIPPKTRERFGKDLKVTKDTAKILYFELGLLMFAKYISY